MSVDDLDDIMNDPIAERDDVTETTGDPQDNGAEPVHAETIRRGGAASV